MWRVGQACANMPLPIFMSNVRRALFYERVCVCVRVHGATAQWILNSAWTGAGSCSRNWSRESTPRRRRRRGRVVVVFWKTNENNFTWRLCCRTKDAVAVDALCGGFLFELHAFASEMP